MPRLFPYPVGSDMKTVLPPTEGALVLLISLSEVIYARYSRECTWSVSVTIFGTLVYAFAISILISEHKMSVNRYGH